MPPHARDRTERKHCHIRLRSATGTQDRRLPPRRCILGGLADQSQETILWDLAIALVRRIWPVQVFLVGPNLVCPRLAPSAPLQ